MAAYESPYNQGPRMNPAGSNFGQPQRQSMFGQGGRMGQMMPRGGGMGQGSSFMQPQQQRQGGLWGGIKNAFLGRSQPQQQMQRPPWMQQGGQQGRYAPAPQMNSWDPAKRMQESMPWMNSGQMNRPSPDMSGRMGQRPPWMQGGQNEMPMPIYGRGSKTHQDIIARGGRDVYAERDKMRGGGGGQMNNPWGNWPGGRNPYEGGISEDMGQRNAPPPPGSPNREQVVGDAMKQWEQMRGGGGGRLQPMVEPRQGTPAWYNKYGSAGPNGMPGPQEQGGIGPSQQWTDQQAADMQKQYADTTSPRLPDNPMPYDPNQYRSPMQGGYAPPWMQT